LIDFLGWTFKQGWYRTWFIIKSYLRLSVRVLQYSHEIDRQDDSEIRQEHESALEEEAKKAEIDVKHLRRLDTVRPEPIHHHLGGALQSLSIDVWIFSTVYLFVLLVVLFSLTGVYQIAGLALWAGAIIWRRAIVGAVRRKWFTGEVQRQVSPKLANAAVRISEILQVPYVVMGHSHDPIKQQISEVPSRWYINIGCWLRPPLSAHEGEMDYRLPLTYVLLPSPGMGEAELLKWNRGKKAAEISSHLPDVQSERIDLDESSISSPDAEADERENKRSTVSLRKRRY
jgi:hypothetical protein